MLQIRIKEVIIEQKRMKKLGELTIYASNKANYNEHAKIK